MTAANDEIRQWWRDQGNTVSNRGNLSRRIKEKYWEAFPDRRPPGEVTLLPSPEEAWAADGDFDDMGLIEPDAEPPLRGPEGNGAGRTPPRAYTAEPEEPTVDPGPAHAGKDWRKGAREREAPKAFRGRGAPRKVSVTVRSDISSKISLVLEVPGRVWQARDPVCGGAFIEARPSIADALTEIVCGSPDLVAWFTGSGGQFMLWFNLVMACWPVAMTAAAHHVYHTIDAEPGDDQQPDYGTYAA